MQRSKSESATFWSIIAFVVVSDFATKALAVAMLVPQHVPREVFGEWARLTLVHNPGAAFGVSAGPYSRQIFLLLTVIALLVLSKLYRTTAPGDRLRVIALGLVCGGAIGNLIDRVRSPIGVVDFLDIGFRDWRWPTFNVADMAVSIGAFLLAWALWGEEEVSEPVPKSVTETTRA
ncbi:MAG: signal peptidase II [Gemmatimonadota bacterium]